ncbi:MAG TPA: aldehyde dehydrogenase [Deltaproteobacteria bacterium]|nr:aldehyde dehydrogenase [Deltaproteobacteria bacterium]
MEPALISQIIRNQRQFYSSGITKNTEYRRKQLKKLHQLIRREDGLIVDALKKDLSKPVLEAYAAEVALVKGEIEYAVANLDSWTRPTRVRTPLPLLPSLSSTVPEPLGVVLIISPWNYPFQLAMIPLVGAIAAGNCVVIKPSELSAHTASVIEELIARYMDPRHVSVVNGGPDTARELLNHRFDHIFFTGSSRVGRSVMESASRFLTPVTLELGGKCPCIVDRNINIDYAARRIAWGKFFNAGQSCVAPDYVLVDSGIRDEFTEALKKTVLGFYGTDPRRNPYYARIINRSHFDRLMGYLDQGNTVVGGQALAQELFIAPTVLDGVPPDAPVMQEEIFGPILPLIPFSTFSDALAFVNSRPKPLAAYLFTRDKMKQELVKAETSSGSLCINDAVVQFVSRTLPFGGVGESGMGRYHGRSSFETFSHTKSIVKNTMKFDIPLRYVPYRFKLPLVKWLF